MNNIKSLRVAKKLSQNDIAIILSLPRATYANYERGAREMDYSTLLKLSKFYHVSINYLLGFSEKLELNFSNFELEQLKALRNTLDKIIKSIEGK